MPWERSKNSVNVAIASLRSDSGAASTTAGNRAGYRIDTCPTA